MFIYDIIRAIVSRFEPDSDDEFAILDKIADLFR